MIYSCLENKTDAKYEVLIFEHFHSPGYRGDERERDRGKRNISHKWRRPFSHTTSNSPEYFLMRGRGGANSRGNVTLSLFICVYHQGQCPEYCLWGRQPKLGLARADRFSHGLLPENLISSSTSSGKALVTTELDVLVCNTFSSGGTQCVPKKCDTSSCEAPQAETHRLKSLAHPPAHQEFSLKKNVKKLKMKKDENKSLGWITLLTVAPVALFLCTCKTRQMRGKDWVKV